MKLKKKTTIYPKNSIKELINLIDFNICDDYRSWLDIGMVIYSLNSLFDDSGKI
jgi:hypothetical protein